MYFVIGFSLVFASLGVVLNSILSTVGTSFQNSLRALLQSLRWSNCNNCIWCLSSSIYKIKESELREENDKATEIQDKLYYIICFWRCIAAGWTPCVGPILGSIFTLAATSSGEAYNSLLSYSLGLGVPFLITGAFFRRATRIIRRIVKHLKYFNPVMGAMLVLVAILIFTNHLNLLVNFPLANQISSLEGSLCGH